MSSTDDNGSQAQTSSSSGSLSAQLREVRARQAAAEAAERRDRGSDESSDEDSDWQLRSSHAETHNLVDSLLPSPPRSPPRPIPSLANVVSSRQASAQAPNRLEKSVTVNDIKNRTCWICSDGDDGDAATDTSKRWVHPCKCSLIAHESCLLTWIRSKRVTGTPDPNKIITCPQCNDPYTIAERKPFALQFFEFGDGILRNIVPVAGAGVLGGGILIAATAYGCTAIRLWMGEAAARRTLGGKWPWHFYVDIPLIPFALILSRLRFLDRAMMWLPTFVAFPITHVPFASATLSWTQPYAPTWKWRQPRGQIASARIFPPGPALTILLVPWIRIFYLSLKRKITRKVLSRFVRKNQLPTSAEPQRRRSNVRRRVIVVGQENHLVDAGLGDVGIDAQGHAREVPPGADGVDEDDQVHNGEDAGEGGIQQTIYVTPQSLGRLCLGALSTPFIASLMGKLLAKIADRSIWLQRLLGMHLKPVAKSFGLPTSSRSKTPLANLFSSGSSQREFALEEERVLYSTYDDLDPVWFRNAIGAGIFIVAKDAVQLTYRYLRLNHAREGNKRTKIADRPFEGAGMIEGLELRD